MNSGETLILPTVILIIIPTRETITRSRTSHFLPAHVECGVAVSSLASDAFGCVAHYGLHHNTHVHLQLEGQLEKQGAGNGTGTGTGTGAGPER